MKTIYRLTVIGAAALALGGCSWFGGSSRSAEAAAQPASYAEAYKAYAQVKLAAGRRALGTGATVAALEAFRLAARDPETAATAHNGMAVAYSRLGRTELAGRYFQLAMIEAPENADFAANLARFNRAAYPSQPALAAAEVPAPREVGAAYGAPVTAMGTGTGNQIQRMSRYEVRVGAPATASGQASAAYPVRLEMTESTAVQPAVRVSRTGEYPARIQF